MNPYSILGVRTDATDEQLKVAYRRLTFKHHPDRNPGDRAAEARFRAVVDAYRLLSDPNDRAHYNRLHPRVVFDDAIHEVQSIFADFFGQRGI